MTPPLWQKVKRNSKASDESESESEKVGLKLNIQGGGFRMGNTCIPVADSFRYLAKLIQYCKV